MKIVKPSATIIEDELAALSIYQRIDACASVCYQRPPKPTEEEAQEFCRKMLSVKHMSTLEMAVVHLVMDLHKAKAHNLYVLKKFFMGDKLPMAVATGSIRSFLESSNPWTDVFLHNTLPDIFTGGGVDGDSCYDEHIRFAKPEEIPWQHKHVAARFVVNRAVSHELVRHRPCTLLQESQRFCRYDDAAELPA